MICGDKQRLKKSRVFLIDRFAQGHYTSCMAALGIPRKTKKKRRQPRGQPRGQQSGGTNGVNDALATRAREAFARAREKLHGRIVLRKVKGHAGDTWNEERMRSPPSGEPQLSEQRR
jgi:hypothetical protein